MSQELLEGPGPRPPAALLGGTGLKSSQENPRFSIALKKSFILKHPKSKRDTLKQVLLTC